MITTDPWRVEFGRDNDAVVCVVVVRGGLDDPCTGMTLTGWSRRAYGKHHLLVLIKRARRIAGRWNARLEKADRLIAYGEWQTMQGGELTR